MIKTTLTTALALGVMATLTMSGCKQRNSNATSQPAQPETQTEDVSGLTFYYGIVKSETVKSHPRDHSEASMHKGPPASLGSYHVVLTLFETASNQRIVNARVAVRLGRSSTSAAAWQPMDAMQDPGSESFGRYVELPDAGRYLVEFQVITTARPNPITARFAFERPE